MVEGLDKGHTKIGTGFWANAPMDKDHLSNSDMFTEGNSGMSTAMDLGQQRKRTAGIYNRRDFNEYVFPAIYIVE